MRITESEQQFSLTLCPDLNRSNDIRINIDSKRRTITFSYEIRNEYVPECPIHQSITFTYEQFQQLMNAFNIVVAPFPKEDN